MLLLIILLTSLTGYQADVTVHTQHGSVQGVKDTEGGYLSFYGIPYAGDVSNSHRYKEAPPPLNLPEGFKANNKSIVCAHPTPSGIVGQENCLTLNVFTKNVTGTKPVIVWLNGEEYSRIIDKKFSFKSLVDADIVFVAVNYRLSIFGFLCLGIDEAPGNAGLKDVIHALKWVKGNIENFGGDPNNVILLGHDSGAAMVDLITMSSQSENLVHKAIALSGSAVAPWAVAFNPVGYANALGAALNITATTRQELAKHLVEADKEVLARAINEFEFTNNSILFAPCIENTKLSGSLLEDAPINILKSKQYRDIPYIASFVGEEGTIRAAKAIKDNWLQRMEENFVDFLPVDLRFKDESLKNKTAQEIRRFYFEDKEVNRDSVNEFLEYEGDTLITIPVLRGLRERVAKSTSAVYLLRFNFKERAGLAWPFNEVEGTRHGEILDYLFDGSPVTETPKKMLTNRIVAFAKTGIPITSEKFGDVYWSPMEADNVRGLSINGAAPDKAIQAPLSYPLNSTMTFWNGFTFSSPKAVWNVEDALASDSLVNESGIGGGYVALIVISVLAILGVASFVVMRKWSNIKRFIP